MQNIILDPRYYLKPNEQRASNATLVFRVMLLLQLVHAAICLSIGLAKDPYMTISQVAAYTDAIAELVIVFLQIVLTVFVILWMRRAYANLQRAGMTLSFYENWAAISWFIPFANFIFPYFILKETWIKTQQIFRKENAAYVPVSHAAVRKFWLTFVLPVAFTVGFRWLIGLHEVEFAYYTAFIGHLVGAFACLNGVRMVQDYTKLENEMNDRAQVDYNNAMAESAREFQNSRSAPGVPVEEMPFPSLQQTSIIPATVRPAGELQPGAVIDNSGRAKFLQGGLVAFTILLFIYALVKLYIFLGIDRTNVSDMLAKSDSWTGRLDPFLWIMFAVTLLLSMLWAHQAYSNLHNLHVKGLSFGRNMAALAWIFPLANFYYAYAVVNDIAKQTPQALIGEISDDKQHGRLFNFSWICLVASLLFLAIEKWLNMKEMMNSEDLSNTSLFGFLFALSCAFSLVLAALAVGEISNDEAMLFERAVTRPDTVPGFKS